MPFPVSRAAAFLLACASQFPVAAGDVAPLRPESFDFDDLKMPEASAQDLLDLPRFRRALARQGIVAVKMPDGFAGLRQEVLAAAALCMGSPLADVATISLPGSTTRRTIAGESNTQGDGRLGAMLGAHAIEECLRFERGSDKLRKAAAAVASAFGVRMAQAIESFVGSPAPLPEYRAARNSSGPRPFAELALRGPRLEHFHAYERRAGFAETARQLEEQTLDFHADQGLFVVFSPGMMVSGGRPSGLGAGEFQVRSADEKGKFVARSLEIEHDAGGSLVVLLGDAVRQLGLPRAHELFHVPSHAFRMPGGSGEHQRLWYGLMQLPPNDLVAQNVVDAATSTKLTFGEIREQVVAGAGHEGGSGIGCSPLAQWSEAAGTPRRLSSHTVEDEATCAEGSMWCWMRCMEFPDGVSDTECAAMGENYSIQCVSQFDEAYVSGHGDYNPQCSSTTQTATPRPQVDQPEASGENVSDSDWTALTALTASGSFEHKVVLDEGVGNTVLLWRAADAGPFHAKMIHRGYVGWMGWGLAHPGGRHKGMNGGQVVMGMAWDDGTLSVDEYRISTGDSAFRHWKTPLSESEPENVSLEGASIAMENGVSILEFTVQSSIYKRALNLTSSNSWNTFIWGLTHRDYCTYDSGGYCGHHSTADGDRGRRAEVRGVFQLNLASGEVLPCGEAFGCEADEGDGGDADGGEELDFGGMPQGPAHALTAAIALLSLSAP